jgi:uncharacterized protein (DUF1919 family)
MNLVERIVNKTRKTIFNSKYRKKVQQDYRSRIQSAEFSIICNNCFGGILYHDLGMKFLSPTVNLYMEAADYLEFLENLEFYLSCDITDGSPAGGGRNEGDPVIGLLNNHIKLYGVHYQTFDDLKDSWLKRRARVNYDNLFIIGVYRDGFTDALAQRFCNLPYKNKVFLSHKHIDCENNHCVIQIRCGKNVSEAPPADKMKSCKMRAYDAAFDFVGWLNGAY